MADAGRDDESWRTPGPRGPISVLVGDRPLLLLGEDVDALVAAIRRSVDIVGRSLSAGNPLCVRLERLASALDAAGRSAGSPAVDLGPAERRLVARVLDDLAYQRVEPTQGLRILRRLL